MADHQQPFTGRFSYHFLHSRAIFLLWILIAASVSAVSRREAFITEAVVQNERMASGGLSLGWQKNTTSKPKQTVFMWPRFCYGDGQSEHGRDVSGERVQWRSRGPLRIRAFGLADETGGL